MNQPGIPSPSPSPSSSPSPLVLPPGGGSAFARDLRTTPNLITLSRIALITLAAGLFFMGQKGIGLVLAVTGGITDYVDGYWARKTHQVTRLGEILDQFCDVFFESLVLYIAIAIFHFLPIWFLPIYLAREFWVANLRRFMAGHQLNIASTLLGKLKTNFVMWGCLPTYLSIEKALPPLEPALAYLGRFGITVGLVFSLISGWHYTQQMIAAYEQIAAGRSPSR
jgi:CDP-diacylglycerol--glycerol-3-phosphate 3-phosphatidyltransferase